MLYCYHRFWAPLAALLLAVPLTFTVVAPTQPNLSADELRASVPTPSFPRTLAGVMDLPPQIDAWLGDHFGLRGTFINTYALLTQFVLSSGNSSVLIARDGWMFLRLVDYINVDSVKQSAGLVRRDQQVIQTADMLAGMKDVLASRGARLVVASPPNTASIYDDYLPRWARSDGQVTEQDFLLSALADRGVKTVDLRPVLRAERSHGKVYRAHDTHWTARGAVASFNAIAEATSHADWRFDMASVLGPPVTVTGGDLARMVGISSHVTEPDQFLALPDGRRETFSGAEAFPTYPTYTMTLDQPGPTVLIIGDSFTRDFFGRLIAQRVGRVVWTHHRVCGFDWKWVEQFRPDEVWWMPTERQMLCRPGASPKGFPSQQAVAPKTGTP
jgi:alginate O-acetyltransferase complex protein AlgJ